MTQPTPRRKPQGVPETHQHSNPLADLRAEYELEVWAAHVAAEAAEVLIGAGWDIAQTTYVGAFRLTTAADAAALLARPSLQWKAGGWWDVWPIGGHPRFAPADAARLADAGITYAQARDRRDGGQTTVEAILAASAPTIGDDITRIIVKPIMPGGR